MHTENIFTPTPVPTKLFEQHRSALSQESLLLPLISQHTRKALITNASPKTVKEALKNIVPTPVVLAICSSSQLTDTLSVYACQSHEQIDAAYSLWSTKKISKIEWLYTNNLQQLLTRFQELTTSPSKPAVKIDVAELLAALHQQEKEEQVATAKSAGDALPWARRTENKPSSFWTPENNTAASKAKANDQSSETTLLLPDYEDENDNNAGKCCTCSMM